MITTYLLFVWLFVSRCSLLWCNL